MNRWMAPFHPAVHPPEAWRAVVVVRRFGLGREVQDAATGKMDGLLVRRPATAGRRPGVPGGRDRLAGWDLGVAVSLGFPRLAVDGGGRAAARAGR